MPRPHRCRCWRNGSVSISKPPEALNAAGISITKSDTNLEILARTHDTTPAALFALIPQKTAPAPSANSNPLEIEARLSGTGFGGKTLAAFAIEQGLAPDSAVARLAAIGIMAHGGDTLKQIAERHATRPIEIAKVLLLPGYRPSADPATSPSQ
ncbi:hypothetical protein [Thermochromatium tepidum]|uniref:Uncharacterized protein n=1 Tax=Thermochromatium tepidum ATCC 43061 TaxID=316276 RepID=A0A6I6EFS8_THETI|nr:hypothetical protein [Thermochromatium tepidum]QGU32197.1 hypothetical protein E6P07_03865 [Thermochromatium tepidum ATCC 43061]